MPQPKESAVNALLDHTQPLRTRTFVLGMAGVDGCINAADVYALAERAKMSTQQVRLCFRRLKADGLYVQHGRGRKAKFIATDQGRAALTPDMKPLGLAFLQDAGVAPWDRRWRLVGFGVAEAERSARDAMRERITLLGGACLQNGLYVSPHPWEPDVNRAASELGLDHVITQIVAESIRLGSTDEPAVIVGKLWQLDNAAKAYRGFLQAYAPLVDERITAAADEDMILLASLSMSAAFEACIRQDPLLPPELLPSDWPGPEARQLIVRGRELALAKSPLMRETALFQTFDRLAMLRAAVAPAPPAGQPPESPESKSTK